QRDEQRHGSRDEHHGVLDELGGRELEERVPARLLQDLAVEQRLGFGLGHLRTILQKVLPALITKCSTMGPSASAGKYCRPPRIRITPIRRPTNRGPCVGNVPLEAGTFFFAASEPAMAITGTT